MATVNKVSLREEFDRMKNDFDDLSSKGKVGQESMALFKALFLLFNILLVIFLEKKQKKTNNNSSVPSSQTGKDESAVTHEGAKGKGLKENDETFSHNSTKEKTVRAQIHSCDTCGENLRDTASIACERRTKIDIRFEKVILNIDACIKTCPSHNNKTEGRFPPDMQGLLPYGEGLKAYILNLLIAQVISFNRIQKTIATLIGKAISEATILKYDTYER